MYLENTFIAKMTNTTLIAKTCLIAAWEGRDEVEESEIDPYRTKNREYDTKEKRSYSPNFESANM